MKKIFVIALIISITGFISCKKTDQATKPKKNIESIGFYGITETGETVLISVSH